MTATLDKPVADLPARDVLEAAYALTRRNLLLALWDFLAGMVVSGLLASLVVVFLVALILPAAEHDTSGFAGVVGYVLDLVDRVQRPSFAFAAAGVVFSVAALFFAVSAAVQAGIYGRLSSELRPMEPHQVPASFWACVRTWFPEMVGYTAIRTLLDVGWAMFVGLVVVWPVLEGFGTVWTSGDVDTGWTILGALGMAAATLLWLLLFVWRMMALGPIFFERKPLWHAFGDAAHELGARLAAISRLVFGLGLVASPVVLVYVAFALMTTLLATRPDMGLVAAVSRMTLDVVFAISMSLVTVFIGAAFLARHAHQLGWSLEPRAPRLPVSSRGRLRLGEPVYLPGLPGASIVVMPLPVQFPALGTISALFPNLKPARKRADEGASGEGLDDKAPDDPEPRVKDDDEDDGFDDDTDR